MIEHARRMCSARDRAFGWVPLLGRDDRARKEDVQCEGPRLRLGSPFGAGDGSLAPKTAGSHPRSHRPRRLVLARRMRTTMPPMMDEKTSSVGARGMLDVCGRIVGLSSGFGGICWATRSVSCATNAGCLRQDRRSVFGFWRDLLGHAISVMRDKPSASAIAGEVDHHGVLQ